MAWPHSDFLISQDRFASAASPVDHILGIQEMTVMLMLVHLMLVLVHLYTCRLVMLMLVHLYSSHINYPPPQSQPH